MASLRRPHRPSVDRNGHGNTPADDVCTTSFIVSNMHCPTCVSAINHEICDNFPGSVRWVSPNIVTSVVTVEHDPAVLPRRIADVLEEAGYEVSGISSTAAGSDGPGPASPTDATAQCCTADGADEARPSPSSALSNWLSGVRSRSHAARVHLLNCEQCRRSHAASPARQPINDRADGTHPLSVSSSGSRRPSPDRPQSPQSKPAPMSLVTVDSDETDSQESWRATLAVGGMTCASCVNTIKDALEKKDWTTAVAVNLVSNSATVDFFGKGHVGDIVESIEDMGYEAALDKVEPITEEKPDTHKRTVELALQGVYCKHCPARVVNSLAGFRRHLCIITEPTLARPIIKISYVPDAPAFTVRQILAAVQASDPALRASIHHPPSLEERSKAAQRKHQWQLLYRALGTLVVAIPTFIIGIVYMSLIPEGNPSKRYLMMPWTSGISRAQIALFVLSTPVYFFAADVFHRRAIKEIQTLWRKGSKVPILRRFCRFGSMNTLMSLGTTIAYVSSVAQLIAAGVHKPAKVNDTDFYFDSVVFLTLFLLFGRWIEAYSKSKTGDAVSALGKLRPTEAVLVERDAGGKEKDSIVKADLLEFGDTVRIRHGSSPPADGVVVQGESNFDESSLTGEARLIKKGPGEAVYAGTVNKGQPIVIQITGAAGTSMLDQIVNVVREGQTKRAPMEQIADILTTYFVPVVTLIAILTWLVWMILGLGGGLPDDYLDVTSGGWVAFALQFAISVFVVACPCGLGLAAPTAIFVGGGLAAQYGILAKGGGEAFEKASRIDCVVFDKTGTLTEGGQPSITDFIYYPDSATEPEGKEAMLAAVKVVEEGSSHPVAKAIASFCADQEIDPDVKADGLHEIPGKGMRAKYHNGKHDFDILVGNEAIMLEHRVQISNHVIELLHKWKGEAKSIAIVATLETTPSPEGEAAPKDQANGGAPNAGSPMGWWTVAAVFSISDPIRPEAPTIVRALQSRGTRVWMLSGDNDTTARAVATRIGIPADQVISGVLPTQKADKITYLQSTLKAGNENSDRRATVAMVGDGINDSPALTKADVGIAIGSGSDVAISSAEFVLVKSDLWAVVTLLELSRAVFRRVKVNFAWALVYNLVAVPVAAGVLYPVVSRGSHVKLDPVWASLAMALSSISVVMSSLALRSGIPGIGFRERRRETTL